MDSGFYRGTNTDQDTRFTDKEKKLLKQMKFEDILDTKVDLNKINVDVLKPWITCKLNDILGMEDDVVVEYVFTQLEEKNLNPKVMQINLTGFLNARRSREFMSELWQMFVEAQSSPDGIPAKLVEQKVEELKQASAAKQQPSTTYAKAVETDWKHRYQSLTGGRYGSQPNFYKDRGEDERDMDDDRETRRRRDPDDDRDRYLERRVEREEKFFKERKELLRERRHTPSPISRRYSEKADERRAAGRDRDRGERERDRRGEKRRNESKDKDRSGDESDDERRKRKKKSHHRRHGDSDSEVEKKAKSSKKHKKDKKKKKDKN